jgi:hypothetical protein
MSGITHAGRSLIPGEPDTSSPTVAYSSHPVIANMRCRSDASARPKHEKNTTERQKTTAMPGISDNLLTFVRDVH